MRLHHFLQSVIEEIMAVGETELEMVKRHVRQGERHVSRQLKIIADMTLRNQPTNVAKSLLLNFEISLRAHKAHFEHILSN